MGMTHMAHVISRYTECERVSGRGGVTEARIVNRRKERCEGHCIDNLLVFG
jgi:hypothetical protein